jgi:hypothetical protein
MTESDSEFGKDAPIIGTDGGGIDLVAHAPGAVVDDVGATPGVAVDDNGSVVLAVGTSIALESDASSGILTSTGADATHRGTQDAILLHAHGTHILGAVAGAVGSDSSDRVTGVVLCSGVCGALNGGGCCGRVRPRPTLDMGRRLRRSNRRRSNRCSRSKPDGNGPTWRHGPPGGPSTHESCQAGPTFTSSHHATTPPIGSDLRLVGCFGVGESSLGARDPRGCAVLGARVANGGVREKGGDILARADDKGDGVGRSAGELNTRSYPHTRPYPSRVRRPRHRRARPRGRSYIRDDCLNARAVSDDLVGPGVLGAGSRDTSIIGSSGNDARPNGGALGTRDIDIQVAMGGIPVRGGIDLGAGGLGAGGNGDLCTGGLPSQSLLGELDSGRTSPDSSPPRGTTVKWKRQRLDWGFEEDDLGHNLVECGRNTIGVGGPSLVRRSRFDTDDIVGRSSSGSDPSLGNGEGGSNAGLCPCASSQHSSRGRDTGEGLGTIDSKLLAKGGGGGGILNYGLGNNNGGGLSPGRLGNNGDTGALGSNCTGLGTDGPGDGRARGSMGEPRVRATAAPKGRAQSVQGRRAQDVGVLGYLPAPAPLLSDDSCSNHWDRPG